MTTSLHPAAYFVLVWLVMQSLSQSPHQGWNQEILENRGKIHEGTPRFISRGQLIRGILGKNIILPCEVENLGRYNVIWRRGLSMLTAGPNFIVVANKTLRLVGGYNLEIVNLTTQDAGSYVCQLSDFDSVQQVHILEILVPPSIRSIMSNHSLIYRKGDNVTLECEGSGNPTPFILWTREDQKMFLNGEKTIKGNFLMLYKINRHYSGEYICTAYNSVGKSVSIHLKLDVHYAPEIEVPRSTIYTGEGRETELKCMVYAEPPPKVAWYHKGSELNASNRIIMKNNGNKHKMIINNTQKSDFGYYNCVGVNSLGKRRKKLAITGRPSPAVIKTQEKFQNNDSFNISWVIKNYAPLQEIRLFYRKIMVNETFNISGQWDIINLKLNEKETKNVIMSHKIENLSSGFEYEIFIQSKNDFGWSEPSEKFQFHTKKEDVEEIALFSSQSRSEAQNHPTQSFKIFLLIIVINLFHYFNVLVDLHIGLSNMVKVNITNSPPYLKP